VMRMIALGQAWLENGGSVYFLCAEIPLALERRLAAENFALRRIEADLGTSEDLRQTVHWIFETPQFDRSAARVVLDGYHFGADYQFGIKAAGFKLLVVDDYGHADFYHADWVLNQNISAREELYVNRCPDTELLLGPKFAMLRKEFLAYEGWKREIALKAKNVLVTLGGSDPNNVTLRVLEALAGLDLHVKVVIGGGNPHLVEIQKFVQDQRGILTLFEVIVSVANMPELMAWADVAVAAAGSTCYELALMRLPSVIIKIAENQMNNLFELINVGAFAEFCFDGQKLFELMGEAGLFQRRSMVVNQFKMINGLGVYALVDLIR